MYTISKLAKLSTLSEKAIRLYEKNGLLTKVSRSNNNYRYFSDHHLSELKRIISLKSLGLTLAEIKAIIPTLEENAAESLNEFYVNQLKKTEGELKQLTKRKQAILTKISITQKLSEQNSQGVKMEKELKDLINLKKLALKKYAKYGTAIDLFLERERFFDSEIKIQFIEDVKEVLKFLAKTKIKIGPLRGSASSSLILDLIGVNSINPLEYGLVPERFNKDNLYLDFDVEFTRGDEFISFCKQLTTNRDYKFEAYKLPIIDIIAATEKRIKQRIDPKKLQDFDLAFKKIIDNGDFQFIHQVDFAKNTKCYKIFENASSFWNTAENLKILRPQSAYDMWAYVALEGRPVAAKKFQAFLNNEPYENFHLLPEFVQNIMKKNRGHLLYQEEWITILAHFLGNDFNLAENCRREFRKIGKAAFEKYALPKVIQAFLAQEYASLFNFSHIISTWQHAKVSAYLKAHHRDIYLEEIKQFETQNPNYSWADFGFKSDGIILMQ